MRETTEATKESADAAIASVRAWLVLTETETKVEQIDNIPPDPLIPIAVVHFQNAGKTPATDVLGYTEFKAVKIAPNSEPHYTKCPPHIARRDAVVNAGGSSAVWAVPNTFTRAERALIDSGEAIPHVHGCITYRDVLNPKQTRMTEFAGFITGWWGNRNSHAVIVKDAHWETFPVRTK